MTRFKQEYSGEDGWSEDIFPYMGGLGLYRLVCCDCDLVHDVDFKVVRVIETNGKDHKCELVTDPSYRVMMKVRRNNRSTSALRRNRKG